MPPPFPYGPDGAAPEAGADSSIPPNAVLLTRPLQGASHLSAEVLARGWHPVLAPMLDIHPRAWRHEILVGAQAVLLTSGNAALRLVQTPGVDPALAVHCVGPATAEPLIEAGFSSVHWSDGTAAALAQTVRGALEPHAGALVHLSGDVVSQDLGQLLEPAGFEVRREIVYEARPVSSMPETAVDALTSGRLAAVLLLSVRTARTFAMLTRLAKIEEACRSLRVVALSRPIAEALEPLRFAAIQVACEPNRRSLIEALGRTP